MPEIQDDIEELKKKNEELKKKNVTKDATIKESFKKPIEIKSPEEDEDTTDWYDKNIRYC